MGIGAAAAAAGTKKKLKCQSCGENNDVGSAQPYKGPKSKRAAKKSGALELDQREAKERESVQAVQEAALNASAATIAAAENAQPDQAIAGAGLGVELERLAKLYTDGLLDEAEFATAKARLFEGDS